MIKDKKLEAILKVELDDLNNLNDEDIAEVVLTDEDGGREDFIETLKSNYPLTQNKAEKIYEEILNVAKEKFEVALKPTEFNVEGIYEELIEGADKWDERILKDAIEDSENIGGTIDFSYNVEERYGIHGGLDPEDCYLRKPLTDEQTDKMIELYGKVINELKRLLKLKESSLCE